MWMWYWSQPVWRAEGAVRRMEDEVGVDDISVLHGQLGDTTRSGRDGEG